MAKDYYAVLGVSKSASQDEIKKAYRKLAHTYHPDKQGGDEAKFKEINEAYSVIGDPQKRSQYDQFGQTFGQGGGAGFGGFSSQGGPASGWDFSQFGGRGGFDFGGTNFEDLFTDIFTGGRGQAREARGADVQVDVEIRFEEMVRGVKKAVPLRTFVACKTCHGTGGKPGSKETTCTTCQGNGQVRKEVRTILGIFTQASRCETCHGRGKTYAESCPLCKGAGRVKEERTIEVSIPAGIEDGQALSVSGEGEAGEGGVKAGDLFVVVHVRPSEVFTRRGDDIVSVVKVAYSQLVLGDKVEIPTLNGSMTLKVPAGTAPGEIFRIKNGGIPHLSQYGRGDHLVKVELALPKHPSAELKKLLSELQRLGS